MTKTTVYVIVSSYNEDTEDGEGQLEFDVEEAHTTSQAALERAVELNAKDYKWYNVYPVPLFWKEVTDAGQEGA